jgi:cytochrome b
MSSILHPRSLGTPEPRTVKVWDILVRVFHWSFAASFAGAWLTAESERFRDIHVFLGYTMLGLVAFRLLWGVVGPRHARFSSFVRGPAAVARYQRSLFTARPEHHLGHNPAGAVAIVLLLALAALAGASGWAVYNDLGGEWLEESHEFLASAMLAVVAVHLAGVAVASWMHRENLVRAMLTGRKDAPQHRT